VHLFKLRGRLKSGAVHDLWCRPAPVSSSVRPLPLFTFVTLSEIEMTALRHLISILILPFTVTVVVPFLLLPPSDARPSAVARLVGVLLLTLGLLLAATTIWHFAMRGRGTLAPWDPPRRLVVHGIYRYVRNPMISGVFLILLAQSLLIASVPVAVWAAAFFAVNATYIPLVEERGLLRRFGAEYELYRRNVPRWIPRRSAWNPASSPTAHEAVYPWR
jgi:protein-S-isoprenylcysteine O-methyltransferase Ste14